MNRLIDSEKHAEYPATRTVVRENGMRIPDPEAFDRPNLSDGVAFGLCLRDDDPAPCRDDERAAETPKKGVPAALRADAGRLLPDDPVVGVG